MNRKQNLKVTLFVLTLAICLVGVRLVSAHLAGIPIREPEAVNKIAAPLGTIVGGDIITDTIWTLAGSPYSATSDVNILVGVMLTVEPGVEVQFADYTGLWVEGMLKAIGTAAQPITFTSALTTPAPGTWRGLTVETSSASAQLDYVTVEYGGDGRPGNVYVWDSAVVTVTHSTLRNGSQDGVYTNDGGVAHIADTRITGNGGYALEYADGSVNPQLSNLTVTGNGTDAIVFGSGDLTGARVWKSLGIPYLMTGDQNVPAGATLTVESGVKAQFTGYTGLWVQGTLKAMGTAAQPITFTSALTTPAPGAWRGLTVETNSASAQLDYVTVEYGGDGRPGSVYVYYGGQVSISHSELIYSSSAGLYAAGGTGVSIEFSQIVSNTDYGVWNDDPENILMAANNWWGSASGPTVDGDCNPGGTGSRVSAGVVFYPYLSAPNATPSPLTPRDVFLLQASPSRWFVPADGNSPAWISITLRTGAGQLAPNRGVRVSTSLGDVANSSLTTNAAGQTFTYLTSDVTGTAIITVTSGTGLSGCVEDWAVPAYTQVSFTAAEDSPLMPNGEAPYMNDRIDIEPRPLIQGVPSTITVQLTNPFSSSITVEGTLGYLQFGVGQLFGPVKEVSGWVIPAHSEQVLSVPWTPPLSDHYCLEFRYSYTGGTRFLNVTNGKGGRSQRNLDVYQANNNSPGDKSILDRARKAIGWLDRLFGGQAKGLDIPRKGAQAITNFNLDMSKTIGTEMGSDPPRQDYKIIAMPQKPDVPPLQPGDDVSPALAAAYNAFVDAQLDVNAYGQAIIISYDRSGGAAEAGEYEWVNQQTAAILYYEKQMGQALLNAADAVDSIHDVLIAEGVADVVQTADEVRAYQDQLRTLGFSQVEIDAAHLLGLSDAEIEAIRQATIAADPNEEAGSMREYQTNLAAVYREWGNAFLNPSNFPEPIPDSGVARAASAEDNNLAQFFQSVFALQVGNPLSQTATVELVVRRIDIPNDWIVSTDWVSATLAAGQQLTATITVIPASASVQGTQPRIAVEGYIGDQLIGGVVLGIVVPQYVAFIPHQIYLPLVLRQY